MPTPERAWDNGWITLTPEALAFRRRCDEAGVHRLQSAEMVAKIAEGKIGEIDAAERLKLPQREERALFRRTEQLARHPEPDDEEDVDQDDDEDQDEPEDEDTRPATVRQIDYLRQHVGNHNPVRVVKPDAQLAYVRSRAARHQVWDGGDAS